MRREFMRDVIDHLQGNGVVCAMRGGGSTRIGGGLDGGDVAFDEGRDEAAAHLFPPGEGDVRGFQHGVGRFEKSDEAFGFDHA